MRATAAAALAAGTAYLSLAATPFRGFRDFGIIGGMGMACCWISAYTVLPAALAFVERRGWIRVRPEPAAIGWFERALPTRPRPGPRRGGDPLRRLRAGRLALSHPPSARDQPAEHGQHQRRARSGRRADGQVRPGLRARDLRRLRAGRQAPRRGRAARAQAAGRGRGEAGAPAALQPGDHARRPPPGRSTGQAGDPGRAPAPGRPPAAPPRRCSATPNAKTLQESRPPDNLRALGDADVPLELAWPYVERDGTRGRIVLANTGLGIDSWNTRDLRRFAAAVRGLGLGPDVLVGGSAFVFTDMLERHGARRPARDGHRRARRHRGGRRAARDRAWPRSPRCSAAPSGRWR